MGKKVTMKPGDWIAKEDIRNEHHLESIRDAVSVQGWDVTNVYGIWETRNSSSHHNVLGLDEDGVLLWKCEGKDRRIDPDELLGYDQTAGGKATMTPEQYASLWFAVPDYGKPGAKVVNYQGEQVASFEEKTEAIEAVEAYNRTILEGNR